MPNFKISEFAPLLSLQDDAVVVIAVDVGAGLVNFKVTVGVLKSYILGDIATDVANNTSNITANGANITTNTGNISANTGNIAINTTNISTIATYISTGAIEYVAEKNIDTVVPRTLVGSVIFDTTAYSNNAVNNANISYATALDPAAATETVWVEHNTIADMNTWIQNNINGNEKSGDHYQIRLEIPFNAGAENKDASVTLWYTKTPYITLP